MRSRLPYLFKNWEYKSGTGYQVLRTCPIRYRTYLTHKKTREHLIAFVPLRVCLFGKQQEDMTIQSVASGVQTYNQDNLNFKYEYVYHYDDSSGSTATALILIAVGTKMSVGDYADLAGRIVQGKRYVCVVIDHNADNMVKLSGAQFAAVCNLIVGNPGTCLANVSLSRGYRVLLGGHSAGGAAAADAMMATRPGTLNFTTNGYIGLDPYGNPPPLIDGTPMSQKVIAVPTFATGFTRTTWFVNVDEAALAAHNVCTSTNNKTLFRVNNPSSSGIDHNAFTTTKWPIGHGSNHQPSQMVRQAVADGTHLLVQSLQGIRITAQDYQNGAATFLPDVSIAVETVVP